MTLLVVGASHRTCPLPALERLAAAAADPAALAQRVLEERYVNEAMVVSTCNRVEIYVDVDRFHSGVAAVSGALSLGSGVDAAELGEHMYAHYDGAAVEHVFQVVAGLDSMALGEAQILGQVRGAYSRARAAGQAGGGLAAVVERALRVGRRARAETGLDRLGNRMVVEALHQAAARVGPLEQAHVAVVGAGGMAALVTATLARRGVGAVTVLNRTRDRAERLAASVDGAVAPLADLPRLLREADVVVSCTGSVGHVVEADDVAAAVAERHGRPLVLVDLALPRDVGPLPAGLAGVTLVDLEGLGGVLAAEGDGTTEVARARGVVADEVRIWRAEVEAATVTPTVVALRSQADAVVAAELTRLRGRLGELDPSVAAEVERTVRRVVDKVLHTPTVRVKELAGGPDGSMYAEALQTLFGLQVADTLEPVHRFDADRGTGAGAERPLTGRGPDGTGA
ncbi:glutamyl-tRNA reductase [Jannaschia sp. R86511]|uniref:glutamyl-tRNA reductase n=1 Tax=Jannaschia sp. R86511 TaxID=3093853 RepID=UPI0036D43AD4